MQCNHCQRPTEIRRSYSLGIMIVLILVFVFPAFIYYFMCKRKCEVCKGTDISGAPSRLKTAGIVIGVVVGGFMVIGLIAASLGGPSMSDDEKADMVAAMKAGAVPADCDFLAGENEDADILLPLGAYGLDRDEIRYYSDVRALYHAAC